MLFILGWIFIILGSFFIASSVVGLFRFSDFFNKIHAAGVADSFGIPLCLFGLSLMQTSMLNVLKIWTIIALFFILNPTSSHALIKAAWVNKEKK